MKIEIFNTLIWWWIALGLIIMPLQFRIAAPYGRHTTLSWGPMIDNRIGWFVLEVPSLIIFSYFIITGNGFTMDFRGLLCFSFAGHYIYRALIFPMLIRTTNKKMPLTIATSAIFFNTVNASFNGYWLGSLSSESGHSFVIGTFQILGMILFVTGFSIHFWHDRYLIRLRRETNVGYVIPYGGLFKWVSCPNFLGEIIEWSGFAMMCWSLPAFSFLCWTCTNLIPRAWQHHRWYREHFNDYPKSRKAIIPEIF